MDDDVTVTDLVHAATGGDQEAWNDLVERYAPLVWSVIRSYRLSGQDAEDISQTLWLRLVEHLGGLREPAALPGWIATTTRNLCFQLMKGSRRTIPTDMSADPTMATQADTVEFDKDLIRNERHQALLQAFAELPEVQRKLLMLLVADPPLSYTEISRRLGIPKGSIGPIRGRALRKLRECHELAGML